MYTLAAGDLDPIELARLAPESILPPALPAMLELLADDSTFVGRKSERETLRRQWQLARAGHTVVVLVTGEAGMGKSRLVSELAAEVYAGGSRVLLGCSYEDVDQPYGPFVQAISADAADLSGCRGQAACPRLRASAGAPVARALPGVGGRRRSRTWR